MGCKYYIYNLFVNTEVRNKFNEEGNQKRLSILTDLKKGENVVGRYSWFFMEKGNANKPTGQMFPY